MWLGQKEVQFELFVVGLAIWVDDSVGVIVVGIGKGSYYVLVVENFLVGLNFEFSQWVVVGDVEEVMYVFQLIVLIVGFEFLDQVGIIFYICEVECVMFIVDK